MALAVAAGCGGQASTPAPPTTPTTPPAAAPWVLTATEANAPERCAECHAEEVRLWKRGGHSRSVRPAARDTVSVPLPGASPWAPPNQVETAEQDGRLTMTTLDVDGRRRTFPVPYVIGGSKLEMYLTTYGPDQRPQVLPAMWSRRRSEWVGYWEIDLKREDTPAPPGDPRFWTERSRTFVSYCNRCHSPRTGVAYDPDAGRYDIDWGAPHDLGVSCAACHGDATAHVQSALAGGDHPTPTARDALPDRSARGRVHACGRCHVSAEWVSLEDEVDTDFYDVFLPLVLDDTWHFWPDGRHRDHAYLFMNHVLSQCYRKGNARCESCHEIHGETFEESRVRSVAACNRCHPTTPDPCRTHPHGTAPHEVRDCVDCHMPGIPIERGHGLAHDHRISVPDPVLTIDLGVPNACTNCHTDQDPRWAVDAMTRWKTTVRPQRRWALAIGAGLAGRPDAAPELEACAAADDASWVYRASAARILSRYPSPAAAALLAQLATDGSHPMVRASAAFGCISQPGEAPPAALRAALRDPRRAVRVMAAAAVIVRNQQPELATALAEIEAVVTAIADHKEMHFLLAMGWEKAGDIAKARAAYARVVALVPRDPTATDAQKQFEERVGGKSR